MKSTCEHKNFKASVSVDRIEDIGKFMANVKVECAMCGTPFMFSGMGAGLSYEAPMASVDFCEARMPITPWDETIATKANFYPHQSGGGNK